MPLFAQMDDSISKWLQGPDYVMLTGYFVLMLGLGLYFYRNRFYAKGRFPMKPTVLAAIMIVTAGSAASTAQSQQPAPPKTGLDNPLAIRIYSYGRYQDSAWTHAPSLGLRYLFLGVPATKDIAAFEQRLVEHRLRPLVLRGDADLGRETSVEELAEQLAACRKMGVRYMFLSPKHTGVSKEVAYERLRRIGDIARQHNVIVALETHPDLGQNADAHLETMRQVNHSNIRVNFDTGNITYYNLGRNDVAELKKIIDYVATIELKDHNGQYMEWNFPALGHGVVDIPAVLKILEAHNYRGPITIEVEGIQGVETNESQTKQCIAESVRYIQSLGNFK